MDLRTYIVTKCAFDTLKTYHNDVLGYIERRKTEIIAPDNLLDIELLECMYYAEFGPAGLFVKYKNQK